MECRVIRRSVITFLLSCPFFRPVQRAAQIGDNCAAPGFRRTLAHVQLAYGVGCSRGARYREKKRENNQCLLTVHNAAATAVAAAAGGGSMPMPVRLQ